MAGVLAVRATMGFCDEREDVHPFFGIRIKSCDNPSATDPIAFTPKNCLDQPAAPPKGASSGGPARKAGKPCVNPTKASQRNGVGRKASKIQTVGLLEVDPNLGRRKRRKSIPQVDGLHDELLDAMARSIPNLGGRQETATTPAAVEGGNEAGSSKVQWPSRRSPCTTPATPSASGEEGNAQNPPIAIDRTQVDVESSVACDQLLSNAGEFATDPLLNPSGLKATRKQKILRLNPKTGTIGSPPQKRSTRSSNVTEIKKKPGKGSQVKCLIVTIKYGQDSKTCSSVGQILDELLSGAHSASTLRKPASNSTIGPPKSTHPFFLGKIAPKGVAPNTDAKVGLAVEGKSRSLKTSMTLGEARSHSPVRKGFQAAGKAAFAHFGNSTKTVKFPGAAEPCWPPKGMVHVRGLTEIILPIHSRHVLTQKKSKYAATETLAKDDVLNVMALRLDVCDVLKSLKSANTDDFVTPEKCLRLPEKHYENGFHIQRRVRRELSIQSSLVMASRSSDSEDELQCDDNIAQINPAILRIYKSLPGSLTAFDRSQYETQSWINKYSPCSAAEVLQCGKEAFILKNWLQALTITAVDGFNDTKNRAMSAASRRSASSGEKLKKKRKSNKLEGFVISSEEEGEEGMDEISDTEADIVTPENLGLPKRTLVRSCDALTKSSRRLRNAVVVSGPSGCGKTAMVYGVAKELGFEVFEINSSSRRSGKEILERVGDMTRNHLVQHSALCPSGQDEDLERISDALAADLKSGRQGTMNAFFKPKNSGSSVAENTPRRDATDAPKQPRVPPKQQRQSLILLEEADILFEDDKQFWTTVMNLIAQSRRPVIITCNDEELLPLQALELHAIIRLSPPPQDVAIDYMLMVAAAEGHLIKRKAVKTLYEARHCDLRAALTELDYWCQIGVGDRKGGLDWFYPRWPPGCDVDELGYTIRVVSEGTYTTGMGWLGRDFILERFDEPIVKEEVLREVWDGWNIDLGDWHEGLDMVSLLNGDECSRLSLLSSYEAFTQSMSMADICAYSSLATGNQVLLDTSSPVSEKARDDYVIGYELLQADTLTSYNPRSKEIPIWIKSQAREVLQSENMSRLKAPSESQISAYIADCGRRNGDSISRKDFSIAFDPIAEPERNMQTASALEPSVFDRTTSTIALDVAPYVRSIVAYDAKLQEERARLSNLLSEGGRKTKRLRTTRSALSALEGGARKTTRPERYFRVSLNPHLVNRTGLQSWQDAVATEMSEAEVGENHQASDVAQGRSPRMNESP